MGYKFIDEVKVSIASGKGGAGCISFRRELFVPRGGPDGGDGGRGGNVLLKVDSRINTLIDFMPNKLYKAKDGFSGSPRNCTGAQGEDLILFVPKGTLVRKTDGELIVDMGLCDEFLFLNGGRGGKGNTHFKSSVNQIPQKAQSGEEGKHVDVTLELKLLADVGLIGFPNVGKSTLISRLSSARPKIANYPFTTLIPHLGVVRVGTGRSFVVADIPGLIEKAHEGHGLGHQFLKHVERTRVFAHLIDVSEFACHDPLTAYKLINEELYQYDLKNEAVVEGYWALSGRKQLIVLNKVDSISDDKKNELKIRFKAEVGEEPMIVSAVTGEGLKELVEVLSTLVFEEEEHE